MLNLCVFIGNVCKDAEIHTTQQGIKKASFILAVDRGYNNAQGNREADFIPIVAWRERAEFAEKYIKRGKKVNVVGSLQFRQYDAQGGGKRTVAEVIADKIAFIEPKRDEEKPVAKPVQPTELTPADHEDDLPF